MPGFEFVEGQNCWRKAQAERLALIIDGQEYFRRLRQSLIAARHVALMIGWDFDLKIDMLPGESDEDGNAPDGFPNYVGDFLEALVKRRPSLQIYLLKWSGGAIFAPGSLVPALRLNLVADDNIHLAFDGRHPIGACHHQKIVVIDDSLAYCGGIDVTDGRWDTREHRPDDARRVLKNDQIAQPWHDATVAVTGDAARAFGELARMRWKRTRDEEEVPDEVVANHETWPEGLEADFRDIEIAIARTEPPEPDRSTVTEIEELYLDSIAAAETSIYLESQYFAADEIAYAIADRLAEPDGPDVVVINPEAAQGMVEDRAMHIPRSRLIRELRKMHPDGRFRILYPTNSAGDPIYVHAKIAIIDDWMLRVGSSNLDRRSMGFDTEADIALIATRPADRARIRAIRADLLGEHLNRPLKEIEAEIDEDGLIPVIDAHADQQGRGLFPIETHKRAPLSEFLAETRIFDPRFRSSARDRLGLTNRHLLIGIGLGGAALLLAAYGMRRRARDK